MLGQLYSGVGLSMLLGFSVVGLSYAGTCDRVAQAMVKVEQQERFATYMAKAPHLSISEQLITERFGTPVTKRIGKTYCTYGTCRTVENLAAQEGSMTQLAQQLLEEERTKGTKCTWLGIGILNGTAVTKHRHPIPMDDNYFGITVTIYGIMWIGNETGLPLYQERNGSPVGTLYLYGLAVK